MFSPSSSSPLFLSLSLLSLVSETGSGSGTSWTRSVSSTRCLGICSLSGAGQYACFSRKCKIACGVVLELTILTMYLTQCYFIFKEGLLYCYSLRKVLFLVMSSRSLPLQWLQLHLQVPTTIIIITCLQELIGDTSYKI